MLAVSTEVQYSCQPAGSQRIAQRIRRSDAEPTSEAAPKSPASTQSTPYRATNITFRINTGIFVGDY